MSELVFSGAVMHAEFEFTNREKKVSDKVLTFAQANIEQTILNAEAESISSDDIYAWLSKSGLPSEAAIRLKSLVEVTREVGGRIINVGKIILIKLIEFVKAHPNLAIGMALGAAIGALVSMVPLLGSLLAPIAALIGVTLGALAGHGIDKANAGQAQNLGGLAIGQDLIEIAKAFFALLIGIFNATLEGQVLKGV